MTNRQWRTPAPACRFRTAHLRTIWSPVPHRAFSHRNCGSAPPHRIFFLW